MSVLSFSIGLAVGLLLAWLLLILLVHGLWSKKWQSTDQSTDVTLQLMRERNDLDLRKVAALERLVADDESQDRMDRLAKTMAFANWWAERCKDPSKHTTSLKEAMHEAWMAGAGKELV